MSRWMIVCAALLCLPAGWAQRAPESPYQQGLSHHASGRYQQAIVRYSSALRINPRQVAAYVNRAICRQQTGDMRGALADLSRAVRLDPADGMAWGNRGQLRQSLGDLRGALADYTRGITLTRQAWLLHLNRGTARQQAGDLAAAARDYKLALMGQEHFAEAHYNLATIAQHQGQLKSAAADFKAALRYATPRAQTPIGAPDGPRADVAALIVQLGASAWTKREAASRALIKIGTPAIRQLSAALTSTDAEVRARAHRCLQQIQGTGVASAALQTHNTPATRSLAQTALNALKATPGKPPRPIRTPLVPADLALMRSYAKKK